jgi:hypothetical protein
MITSAVFAQPSELALHLFGIVSLPNGDFGKDLGDNARLTRRAGFDIGDKVGLAQTGFGCGAELISPVWFQGLQWIFSAKTLVNSTKEETAQSEFRSQLGDSVDVILEYGQWINIPVMTGFRYDYYFTHKYALYGIIQGGINFSKAASRKVTIGDLTVEDTNYKWTRDFGYELSIGLLFDQTYNIGFRYLSLSTPRYEGTQYLSETRFPSIIYNESGILGEKRSISMYVVTLGIQLFK